MNSSGHFLAVHEGLVVFDLLFDLVICCHIFSLLATKMSTSLVSL
jgi:hypothetical protein